MKSLAAAFQAVQFSSNQWGRGRGGWRGKGNGWWRMDLWVEPITAKTTMGTVPVSELVHPEYSRSTISAITSNHTGTGAEKNMNSDNIHSMESWGILRKIVLCLKTRDCSRKGMTRQLQINKNHSHLSKKNETIHSRSSVGTTSKRLNPKKTL